MSYTLTAAALWCARVTTPVDTLVLIALADRAKDDGSGVWYRVNQIATLSRLNERTVRRSLQTLEMAGLIEVTKRPRQSSIYRVLPGALSAERLSTDKRSTDIGSADSVSRSAGTESATSGRRVHLSNKGTNDLTERDDSSKYDAAVIG